MAKYETIYEDDNYLVINKPAGLLAHGGLHIKELTLAEELLKIYPSIAKVGDDPSRPGLMHRLDKLASGLMVIAKNQEAFDNLKSQFKKRTVKKFYTALVYGKILKEDDTIDFPIQRSAKGYKMAAIPKTYKGETVEEGRRAETYFEIIKKYINYTLLKVEIKTGRTHQIRVHMAAYGHPLVGDDLYGTRKTKEKNKKLAAERIFLVADELEFADLQGEKKHYKINLPEDLKNMLIKIK